MKSSYKKNGKKKIISNGSSIMEKIITSFIILSVFFYLGYCYSIPTNTPIQNLKLSKYVTIVIACPEAHADIVRDAMAKAGAGKIGNYSHCSYSQKGIARFMPNEDANPHIGKAGVIEELTEERIETVCSVDILEQVCEAIKQALPYEELVIDIFPIYEIGRKKGKNSN